MSILRRASKRIVGWTFLIAGFWIVLADVHSAIVAGRAAHIFNNLMGLIFVYVGGYLNERELTERIADGVARRVLPLLDRIPGGRRKTDPPTAAGDAINKT